MIGLAEVAVVQVAAIIEEVEAYLSRLRQFQW